MSESLAQPLLDEAINISEHTNYTIADLYAAMSESLAQPLLDEAINISEHTTTPLLT